MNLNDRLARAVTGAVGTMWAAYAFAALALVSLPAVLASRSVVLIVAWTTQAFLQLVLLPIIMVGQRLQTEATDELVERHTETHRLVAALHRHHIGGSDA